MFVLFLGIITVNLPITHAQVVTVDLPGTSINPDPFSLNDLKIYKMYTMLTWSCKSRDFQHTGRRFCIGAQTNALKWVYRWSDDKTTRSSPAIGKDGTLYIGIGSELWALTSDGLLKWRYTTEGIIVSSPSIWFEWIDGTIYFGSQDNCLYALDPNGVLKWRYETDESIESSPAIGADGTICIGSRDNYVYAFTMDGSVKWKYKTAGGVISSPAICTNGTIYVGSEDKNIYALNSDGTLKWRYQTEDYVLSSPSVGTDGTIFIGSNDKNVYALNPDGTLKWKYKTEGYVISSPAIETDGTVYIGSDDGKVYAINSDGSLKWHYQTEGPVRSSPAIGGDGTVYIMMRDYLNSSNIYAIDPNGNLKWDYGDDYQPTISYSFDFGSSPAIGSDGTVYAVSRYHLYAFGEDTTPPEIFCSDITVQASGDLTKVFCTVRAIDSADPCPIITYDPGPIGEFPLGTSEIKVTASDSLSNISTRTFKVTVTEGRGELADNAWSCEKHDAGNTGRSPYIGAQTNTLKWTFQTKDRDRVSSPLIGSDGTLYFIDYWDGVSGGRLYALNPNGKLKWSQHTSMSLGSPVIGAHGVIYVGGWWGWFYAFTPEGTEDENLIHPTIPNIMNSYYPPPTIGIDGTFYVGSPGRVTAFNQDGSSRWIYPLTEDNDIYYAWYSKPAIGCGGTIFATQYGHIHAISPNGAQIWIYRTEETNLTMPVINDNGTIYVGGNSGIVYAFDPNSVLKWSYQTGGEIRDYLSPSIGVDGTIYIPCDDQKIYALTSVGSLKWCYPIEDTISTSFAVGVDNVIYFGTEGGKVYALDPNGNLKWSYQTGGEIDSTPAIGIDGTVYVGSDDGKVYAFGLGDSNFVVPETQFKNIVVFGDSLSDNGNYYNYTAKTFPDNEQYFEGRYSNGLVWVEYLADERHLHCNLSDFAYGDAKTDSVYPPGLIAQVTEFLSSPPIPEKTLCIIWIGANDFLSGGIDCKSVADNIHTALNMLVQAGIQDILVLNLPNLAANPSRNDTPEAPILTILTISFNDELKTITDDFIKNNPSVHLYFIDIFSYFEDLVANPQKYGFTNSTETCPNFNVVDNFENEGYIFWDHIHPTTEVHKFIADEIVSNMHRAFDGSQSGYGITGTDKSKGGCFITVLNY